jgi:hypothetical protein
LDVAIPLLEIPKLFNLYIEEVHEASGKDESKNKGKSKMIDEVNKDSKDVEMEDEDQDDPNSSMEALEAIDTARAQASNNTTNSATNNANTLEIERWRVTFPPLVLDNLVNTFTFESEGDIRLFWAAMYQVIHRVIKLEDLAEEMARNAVLLRFEELYHASHSLTFAEVFPFYKVHFILTTIQTILTKHRDHILATLKCNQKQ